jgi:hypothetical protein
MPTMYRVDLRPPCGGIQVGDHDLSYLLDLDRRIATVVFVEHAPDRRSEDDGSSSAA